MTVFRPCNFEGNSYPAENGQIIAAIIDGEATVKRFYKEKGLYRLQPENPNMEPIIVLEVEILGRVVSSQRYY